MKIKHVLASAKDKKPTIIKSEMSKVFGSNIADLVTLNYASFSLTYKKSRNGATWYCTSIPPTIFNMPKIGVPVYHELTSFTTRGLFNKEFQPIRDWAEKRGIYAKGDPKTQCVKLFEEVGELSKAILKGDADEMVDAIGDIVVVLTNLAELLPIFKGDLLIEKMTIEDCINSAYKVIKDRTGKMENGTFKKD